MEIQSRLLAILALILLSVLAFGGVEDWGGETEAGVQPYYMTTKVNNNINEYEFGVLGFLNYSHNFKDRFFARFSGFLKPYYRETRVGSVGQIKREVSGKVLLSFIRINLRQFFITLGRDHVVWGTGIIFNPTSYFGNVNFSSKYISYELPVEGFDSIKASYIGKIISAEAVSVFKEDRTQFGARIQAFFEGISASISAFYDGRTRRGAVGSDVKFPLWFASFYGEAVKSQGEEINYTVGIGVDLPLPFITRIGFERFKDFSTGLNNSAYFFIELEKVRLTSAYINNIDKNFELLFGRLDINILEDKSYLSLVSSVPTRNKDYAGFVYQHSFMVTYKF